MYAFKKSKILHMHTPMKSAAHTYCVLPLFPSVILLQCYSNRFWQCKCSQWPLICLATM